MTRQGCLRIMKSAFTIGLLDKRMAWGLYAFLFAIFCSGLGDFGFSAQGAAALLAQDSNSGQQAIQVQVWIGGGDPRTWQGEVLVSGGKINNPQVLSSEKQANCDVLQIGDAIRLQNRSATGYAGFDFWVTGQESRITIRLKSKEDSTLNYEASYSFLELVEQSRTAILDVSGNRCTFSRCPGDSLRLDLGRSHVVMEPGEAFPIQVYPNWTGQSAGKARLRIEGYSVENPERKFFSSNQLVYLDESGSTPPILISTVAPSAEGVYEFEFKLEPIWFRNGFGNRQQSVSRKLQFPVVSNRVQIEDPGIAGPSQVRRFSPIQTNEPPSRWGQFQRWSRDQRSNVLMNESC
ncbi:MAG: hypothetical protein AAF623_10610, partial [Planctomycetota bacterium]